MEKVIEVLVNPIVHFRHLRYCLALIGQAIKLNLKLLFGSMIILTRLISSLLSTVLQHQPLACPLPDISSYAKVIILQSTVRILTYQPLWLFICFFLLLLLMLHLQFII
jgi:hypothetical protein